MAGSVEGQKVPRILLDTGCTRTMVRQQWVPVEKILNGKMVSIRCAHGDTKLYNLADLTLRVQGVPVKVEAAVAERLPVDVLLGTDVPELCKLIQERTPGRRRVNPNMPRQEDVMVVLTRARAKQQLEEEISRRARQAQSGVRPNPIPEGSNEEQFDATGEVADMQQPKRLPEVQTTVASSAMGRQSWDPKLNAPTPDPQGKDEQGVKCLNISSNDLIELQRDDPTLPRGASKG